VHSVNERLRSARRKLGVSSSREAARFLAQAEGDSPKILGDKPFGLSTPATAADTNPGRSETPTTRRIKLIILGGTIMSLIIAALALTWTQPAAPNRPAQWSHITAVSDLPREEVRNLVHLDGNSLVWNGSLITETQLRQYLEITTQMSPQPTLVLRYTAQTKPARIEAIRRSIDAVLQCTPSYCREVTLAQGHSR
jgi:hypothetical protein